MTGKGLDFPGDGIVSSSRRYNGIRENVDPTHCRIGGEELVYVFSRDTILSSMDIKTFDRITKEKER